MYVNFLKNYESRRNIAPKQNHTLNIFRLQSADKREKIFQNMKVLFWRVKVCHRNFALLNQSKPNNEKDFITYSRNDSILSPVNR